MKVVLAGDGAPGIEALKTIEATGHRVCCVLSTSDHRPSIGPNLWDVAKGLKYELLPAERIRCAELADYIRAQRVDVLLNVYALYIAHPLVCGAPRFGSYNLHPGPLPRYAGLNSVSWALLHGEEEHGVALHRMMPKVDAGPIAYKKMLPVFPDDSALTLNVRCIRVGMELVKALLEQLAVAPQGLELRPQAQEERQYFGSEIPHHGNVDWSWPARRVWNFVRACDYGPFQSPWGHPHAALQGIQVELLKTRMTGENADAAPGTLGKTAPTSMRVACEDEWLAVDRIAAGGMVMRGDEFAELTKKQVKSAPLKTAF